MTTQTILSLVAIHATVISIFVALGFGYYSYLLRKKNELLFQVFDEADRVNQIAKAPEFGLSEDLSLENMDPSTTQGRRDILIELDALVQTVATKVETIGKESPYEDMREEIEKEKSDDDDPLEALKILDILSILTRYYPFKELSYVTLEEEERTIVEKENVEFNSMEDVEDWIGEVDFLYSQVKNLFNMYKESITEAVGKAYNELGKGALSFGAPISKGDEFDISVALEAFEERFEELHRISASVRKKKSRWKLFRDRATHPIIAFISILLTWSAFLGGVTYPLLTSGVFRWDLVFIPLVTYWIALISITVYVVRGAELVQFFKREE